jgi:hypothetical protein
MPLEEQVASLRASLGELGDIKIKVAIPIVITKGEAAPIPVIKTWGPFDTTSCPDIGEGAIAII